MKVRCRWMMRPMTWKGTSRRVARLARLASAPVIEEN
jgi:hypothetical protein